MIPAQVTVLDTDASWNGVASRADPPLSVGPADAARPHDLVPSNHRDGDTRSVRLDEPPMQVLLELVRSCRGSPDEREGCDRPDPCYEGGSRDELAAGQLRGWAWIG
jgi:hypothetical protein